MLNQQLDLNAVGFGRVRSFRSSLSSAEPDLTALRRMIWLYFWLLVFEGALRKWIVPSLSAPLLVIRDPLVLLIYVQAIRCRRFPVNGPLLAYFFLLTCFILLALIQIVAGIGGGPLIALYGIRTDFLHLPLIFVIPRALSGADVMRLGRWILLISIPMAALMVLQFSSPPNSWINAATMAEGKQIDFAMGKIRPAGTFSFSTGASHFFVLASAYLVYALAQKDRIYPRWLLWIALFSVAVVLPVSGSRTLVLGAALVVVAAFGFGILCPGRAHRIVAMAALVCTVGAALSLTNFFREAVDVFMTRWDNASAGGLDAGLGARFLGWFLEPFAFLPEAGLIGKGVGMGTNAASAFLTGSIQFLLAEGEWARVVLESGVLLGFSFLAYRVWLALTIAVRAVRAARLQELLPWLLAWDACRSLVIESLSQPTNLGFMVFISGLCLAAMSGSRFDTEMSFERPTTTETVDSRSGGLRSLSA